MGKHDAGQDHLRDAAGGSGAPAHMRASAGTTGATVDTLAQDVGASGKESARATVGRGQPKTGQVISPAFDAHHPPAPELIDDCVHCGFCLPSCPTYLLFGEEMDSPRGRVYLMKEALEGQPLTDTMVRHWDLCLGCLACVTACPSGVQYEKLIESTRQQVERRYRRTADRRLFRRLIFQLFPYPNRLRLATAPLRPYQKFRVGTHLRRKGIMRRLPSGVQAMEALMPELPSAGASAKLPVVTPAQGQRRRTVGMLTGCVQSVFFPHVNAATVRVLAAEGCEVVTPGAQGCCGALSMHAGREAEAQRFARGTIDAFEAAGVENVIVNAAGCGSTMKGYDYLLRDDPEYAGRAEAFVAKVRDASEFLQELGPVAGRHPLRMSVAYHDACHLAHGQGIRKQPRAVLAGIPGLELREIKEAEICCGSAGIYNMVEPEPARELGERKAKNVLSTGAQLLVTANPGCLLQVRASLRQMDRSMPMAHPMEVLDASIRGTPVEALLQL